MVADGFQAMILVGDVLLATFGSVSKQFQVFFDRDDHRALLAQFDLKFGGQLLVNLVEGLVDVGQGGRRPRAENWRLYRVARGELSALQSWLTQSVRWPIEGHLVVSLPNAVGF